MVKITASTATAAYIILNALKTSAKNAK